MIITLNPELEASVQRRIDNGEFADEFEVLHEALRLLDRRDELKRLRESLDLADEQILRGEGVQWTPELLDRLTLEAQDNSLRGKPKSPDVEP